MFIQKCISEKLFYPELKKKIILFSLLWWNFLFGFLCLIYYTKNNNTIFSLSFLIQDILEELCTQLKLKTKTYIGGNARKLLLDPSLDEVDIVVSTLGVMMKLTHFKIMKTNLCRFLVLDEADTLLDDSFSHPLTKYLRNFSVRQWC